MPLIPKILLVNDHLPTLTALETLLTAPHPEEQEYEVLTAQSGAEALRLVLAHQFAVILLDVSMPDMDGFETAELIHSRPSSATTPIIFITAYYADEMNRLRGYELGAVDFLITPVIPQILRSKIGVFVELAKKNLELESTTQQLEALNQNLIVQQMRELKYHNEMLQQEIIERRQAEQRAHELATRDALTGLLNRRSLLEGLESALVSARRHDHKLAVLFIDMDRFKTINDTLGHDIGDQLLIQASQRISASVRDEDIVARLGGDEFVVVVKAMSSYEDAAKIANNILEATAQPFEIGTHSIKNSLSIGISLFPQDGEDAQCLTKKADMAMYHVKKEQRGRIYFYNDHLNSRVMERMQLERELQQALDKGELELFYQPKIDIASDRIAGLEALIRWRHPQRGLLRSGAFIDDAIEAELVAKVGDWVIAAACTQLRRWQDAGLEFYEMPLAVNIAIPQINPDLPSYINQELQRTGLHPSYLQLEITESLLIRDLDRVAHILQEISHTGVTIAIDDFGTGYSSLSRLKALPIDILKIDQSFVRNLELDRNDSAIIAAIVNMAHALDLKVVAEGVETEAQLNILRELQCDEHQGYLYSEPLNAHDMTVLLKRKQRRLRSIPASRALTAHG
ncbi:diguanylate cyclase [Novimethylophilus kurashikiensis]|uniref:Diguanylate cyclase n=1 Tax=Novimethylophilus kurashikiensis TaxID=1825523 RepID=A0A2R5F733_9PROT|nr:EAL domain-containing protein [Novimethylophilus kurashikiensis]GBG14040.1 diguanylate cyclase [Novimethylophilus kurashikiensis]